MDLKFLDFEQQIAELEAKIEQLRNVHFDSELNISEEVARLEEKNRKLTESIYAKLSAWQISQISRQIGRAHV
jgi:acetyl-CoA carboxylase carboxyl transferase subunit alpha